MDKTQEKSNQKNEDQIGKKIKKKSAQDEIEKKINFKKH